MKELRAFAGVLSLSTLCLFGYGLVAASGAATVGPAITITQPIHGAVVQGNVTVAVAYRSASGVAVTRLEFYVDQALLKAEKLQPARTEGTYTFIWDPTGLSAGMHTISAVARDARDRAANVAVAIFLDNRPGAPDVQAPVVTLSGPRHGETVSGVVRLLANVVDNAAIKWVSFLLNDKLLFGTNYPPFQYDWDTTKVANGPHAIKVYAYDASENKGETKPIVVQVDNPSGRTLQGERLSTARPQTPAAPAPAPVPASVAVVSGPRLQPQASKLPVPTQQRAEAFAPAPRRSEPPSRVARQQEPPPLPLPRVAAPVVTRPVQPAVSAQPDLELSITPSKPSAGAAAPLAVSVPSGSRQPVAPVRVARAERAPRRPPVVGSPRAPQMDALAAPPSSGPARASLKPMDVAAGGQRLSPPSPRSPRPVVTASAARPSGADAVAQVGDSRTPSVAYQGSGAAASPPPGRSIAPSITIARVDPGDVAPILRSLGRTDLQFAASAAQTAAPRQSGASGAAPPSVVRIAPLLDAAPVTPQATALGGRSRAVALAPEPEAGRLSVPGGHKGAPATVSVPSQPQAVVIARSDPQSHQLIPMAMVITRHATMPSGRARAAARVQPQVLARATTPPAAAATRPQQASPQGRVVVTQKARGPVAVVYNGSPVRFPDVTPFERQGLMLTPFRHIFEHAGGIVLWNNLVKQVKASSDGRTVEFTIGDEKALVNNRVVQMSVAPFLKGGRAIVPLSFVREALDVTVTYDPSSGRITIAAK